MQVNAAKSVFLSLCAVLLLTAGCKKDTETAVITAPVADDSLPTHAQPKLATMKIYLGSEIMDTELALTGEQEETGMMFRTNIQETDSMLFVLPFTMQASFWMKNCPESISAAYINPDGTIAEIHHLEQNDTNPVLSASANIRFVLETREGWFTRHNITPGMVIRTEKGTLAETFLH
jgi:uncharacterized membrane protein (UPF0127 family)